MNTLKQYAIIVLMVYGQSLKSMSNVDQERGKALRDAQNILAQIKGINREIEDIVLQKDDTKQRYKTVRGRARDKELEPLRDQEKVLKDKRVTIYWKALAENNHLSAKKDNEFASLQKDIHEAAFMNVGEAYAVRARRAREPKEEMQIMQPQVIPQQRDEEEKEEEQIMQEQTEQAEMMPQDMEQPVVTQDVIITEELTPQVISEPIVLTPQEQERKRKERIVAYRRKMTTRQSGIAFSGMPIAELQKLLNAIANDFYANVQEAGETISRSEKSLLSDLINEAEKTYNSFVSAQQSLVRSGKAAQALQEATDLIANMKKTFDPYRWQ